MSTRHPIANSRHLSWVLAATILGVVACGSLEPLSAPDNCAHSCNRNQFADVLEYWELDGNAIRFYSWLRSLDDEQLGWVREDGSSPLATDSNQLAPHDHIRWALVLFTIPVQPNDMLTAGSLIDYYMDHTDKDTDEYSFALLLQTSISDSISGRSAIYQQQLALEEMESRVGNERAARETLEHQLEQLKQIEESLLGSSTP